MCFSEPNSGVIYYRGDTDRTRAFLDQWVTAHYRFGIQGDQKSLRELLWRSDVRNYVLPEAFNTRVFEASEPVCTDRPKARTFHLKLLTPQKNPILRRLANRVR